MRDNRAYISTRGASGLKLYGRDKPEDPVLLDLRTDVLLCAGPSFTVEKLIAKAKELGYSVVAKGTRCPTIS